MAAKQTNITQASTAEYFSKNLQQVGFSSYTKAVLTTLKEALDNSLDACEENGILPEIRVTIERLGEGTVKAAEKVRVTVEDNGPGIPLDDIVMVFGEYLASSKFGRGRCSRGQQGIGISAVTTWSQLTDGSGAHVITKTKNMRQAMECEVVVDIKKNQGILKSKKAIDWDKPHGVLCDFVMDGRIQLNGDGGIITYLTGTALVNPHMKLHYKLLDNEWTTIERVSDQTPEIPDATEPHPHTMKLGEFIAHSHLYGKISVSKWLKTGFSRISESVIDEMVKLGMPKAVREKPLSSLTEAELRNLYAVLQKTKLMAPSTKSVLAIGEAELAKSISRLGDIDFFSVVSRKPTICDFKPVLVEVAIARKRSATSEENEDPVNILRFANRVPLQFDKAACAITKSIESVNWKSYGLAQPKKSLPVGPFIIAVSVVSPFIKFKNASKETIDASDELVEEIRRGLIQCGQRLGAHIRREEKQADIERKLQHIEQFAPILVQGLCRITGAAKSREDKAKEGLAKILGRDASEVEKQLEEAHEKAHKQTKAMAEKLGVHHDELHEQMYGDGDEEPSSHSEEKSGQLSLLEDDVPPKPRKKKKG